MYVQINRKRINEIILKAGVTPDKYSHTICLHDDLYYAIKFFSRRM